jgi:hypothetical protein
MSDTNTPKQAGEEEIQQAIETAISGLDLDKISMHQVYQDVMFTIQNTSFKLLLANKLFEHIFVRDGVFKTQEQEDEPRQN